MKPGAARLLTAWHASLLAAALATAALVPSASTWRPVELVVLLGGVAVLSSLFSLELRGMRTNAAFLALVLAMVLLGPAPAVAMGLAVTSMDSALRRVGLRRWLANSACYATFPAIGGLLLHSLVQSDGIRTDSFALAAVVFVGFLGVNFLNFLIIALDHRWMGGVRVLRNVREVYVPVAPVEIATALLTAAIAYGYAQLGLGMIMVLAVAGLVFQYLLHLALESMKRGDELERRTQELASLQVGLLTTVIKTLSLRDKMTARHSAAVARYAREIARELGVDEREQDVVHTAALLHDIGKFVFPDSILFANRGLSDADYEIVKSHPARGAELVAQIEGYGPVADIILAHHERVDGCGYPHGIAGDAIPLAARIISVCDTYDVMTARDSYRKPVPRAEAVAELRRVAGSQLDERVVETFIRLLEERNIAFRHSDDADFEHELNFETRVRDYAAGTLAA